MLTVLLDRNNIIWFTDAANSQRVDELNAECIATARGPDESEYADFQNGTRTEPINRRFSGEGKLGCERDFHPSTSRLNRTDNRISIR